jgi:2-methylcitrate dehydratase PrpD
MTSLTRLLVRRVRSRPTAPPDMVAAERLVRDWLASYVAGQAAPTGRILSAYGAGARDPESRAFLAAAYSHVTETDDLHRASVTHPGCVVIPVAWLLAWKLNRRGHAFLRSVLAGYEAMIRIGEALGPTHYRVFHNTATAGVFGAAAAAADLLELDEDRWVWALGNAGTQAAGLWQFNEEGAMTKPLHAGHAAASGLRAALLAREGFTGPEAILEGEKGFFRALCPDATPESVLAEAPSWKLHETSIKPYPCCRHTHPAIDAALAVRARSVARAPAGGAHRSSGDPGPTTGPLPTSGPLPSRVRILSYPAALDVTDRPNPGTPDEARFSLQWAVAGALLLGTPRLSTFQGPALGDPRVRALLDRITVEADPAFASAYPERWGGAVEVEAADGTIESERRDSATGDPERPLGDAELDDKLSDLLEQAGIGAARRHSILAQCRALVEDGPLFDLPEPPFDLPEPAAAGGGGDDTGVRPPPRC